MTKKLLSLVLIMCIFIPNVYSYPNTVNVMVNGRALITDTPSEVVNNRTMVPFRALFEALGANQITWDEPTQTVTGSDGTTTIKLVIGSYDIEVNGKIETMDTPVMVINSRTMIPLSMVSRSLGATVTWNADTYTAMVVKDGLASINTNQSNQISQTQDIANTDIFGNITSLPVVPNTTQTSDITKISGYYALEDLKRNKYVLNLNINSSAELVDIKTKTKITGTYSYSNGNLSLNVANFKGTFIREDIKYNNNNILFMKDNANHTSGSTFAMIKISETEYNNYTK